MRVWDDVNGELKLVECDENTRTVGMEIEYEFEPFVDAYDRVDELESYENNDYERVVNDGSLDIGMEVVSKIMTIDGLKLWLTTSEALYYGNENSCENAGTNGIHIHYGLQNYSGMDKKRIQARVVILSNILAEQMHDVFRRSSWANPNIGDMASALERSNYSQGDNPFKAQVDFEDFMYGLDYNYGRYRLAYPYSGHGTIEFRVFPYSDYTYTQQAYVDFVEDFMNIVESDMSLYDMVMSEFTIDAGNYNITYERNKYDIETINDTQLMKNWTSRFSSDQIEEQNMFRNGMVNLAKDVDDIVAEQEPVYGFKYHNGIFKITKETDMWEPLNEGYDLTNVDVSVNILDNFLDTLGVPSGGKARETILEIISNKDVTITSGMRIQDVTVQLQDHYDPIHIVDAVIEKVMYNYSRHGLYVSIVGEFGDEDRTNLNLTSNNSIFRLIKGICEKEYAKFDKLTELGRESQAIYRELSYTEGSISYAKENIAKYTNILNNQTEDLEKLSEDYENTELELEREITRLLEKEND